MQFEELKPRWMLDAAAQLLQAVNFELHESTIGEFPAGSIVQADLADVNHDGRKDVVRVSAQPTVDANYQVAIFHGTEGGYVLESTTPLPLSAEHKVQEVQVLNLDGDERLDLVVRTERSLSPFLNAPDGTYQALPAIESQNPIQNMEVVSLTSGHAHDLVFTSHALHSSRELVSVYLSDGSGGFSLEWEGLFFVKSNPTGHVAAGDYDGDGDSDIFVAVGGKDPLDADYVMLENDGSGNLSEFAVDPDLGSNWLPTDVHMDDLNGDGHADILVGAKGFHGVLRAAFGDGTGAFGPWSEYAVNGWIMEMATGDLNGDSVLDVAFTYDTPTFTFEGHRPGVGVLLSNADTGEFDRFPYHGEIGEPGFRVSSIEIDNLNRDGLGDVRLANLHSSFVDGQYLDSLVVAEYQQADRFHVTDYPHQRSEEVNVGMFFDLDADGFYDFIGGTRENEELGRVDRYVTIQYGSESGEFGQPLFAPVAGDFVTFGFGDIDSNGHIDVQARG